MLPPCSDRPRRAPRDNRCRDLTRCCSRARPSGRSQDPRAGPSGTDGCTKHPPERPAGRTPRRVALGRPAVVPVAGASCAMMWRVTQLHASSSSSASAHQPTRRPPVPRGVFLLVGHHPRPGRPSTAPAHPRRRTSDRRSTQGHRRTPDPSTEESPIVTDPVSTPFHVYDTTLRDGAQQEGMNLSVADKLAIAPLLDELGRRLHRGRLAGRDPEGHRVLQARGQGARPAQRRARGVRRDPQGRAPARSTTRRCARCSTPRRRSSRSSPRATSGTSSGRCAPPATRTSR